MTKASESQPQAAQMALTKSLQFEWAYLQRVVPNCGDAFAPLRDTIKQKFWPAVFGECASLSRKSCSSCLHVRQNWECKTQHSFHTPHH